MTTQTPTPGTARLLYILDALQVNGSELLPVAKVIDTLLDARSLADNDSIVAAIDRELQRISARPSLVTTEEAAAIVTRIGSIVQHAHAT